MLPSPLPEFDYEPHFNIGVMLTGAPGEKGFEETSRLGRDNGGKVQILHASGDVDGNGNESSRLVRSGYRRLRAPRVIDLTDEACSLDHLTRRSSGGWTGSAYDRAMDESGILGSAA